MKDTPPEFEAMVRERIARRSPEERLRMGCDMFDMAKAIIVAGLTEIDVTDRRVALFERLYGNDFDPAEKVRIHAHLRRFDASRCSSDVGNARR